MTTLQEQYNNLVKWITDNGGYVNPKINLVKHDKFNRVIVAIEDIDEKEQIVKIPQKCCIGYDNIDKLNIKIQLNNTTKIILALLLELPLKDKSFYFPYIRLLPTLNEFEYHPIYKFDENNKKIWNKYSEHITSLIEQHHKNIQTIYDELKKLNEEYKFLDTLTYNNVKWGYLCSISRQWNNSGFVPIADLLQHSCTSNMLLSPVKEENNINNVLQTDKKLTKSSIVYDNYGIFDDTLQYISFGFIENPDDNNLQRFVKFILNYTLDNSTSVNSFKKVEIDKYMATQKILCLTNVGIQNYLLEYLRIFSIDEQDMRIIDFSKKYYENIISLNNESRVSSVLIKLIKDNNLLLPKDRMIYIKSQLRNAKLSPYSVSYNICKLSLIRHQIAENAINILISNWTNKLIIPYKFNINVDYFEYSKEYLKMEQDQKDLLEKQKAEANAPNTPTVNVPTKNKK